MLITKSFNEIGLINSDKDKKKVISVTMFEKYSISKEMAMFFWFVGNGRLKNSLVIICLLRYISIE